MAIASANYDNPGSLQFPPIVRFWIFAGTFLALIGLWALVLIGTYVRGTELLGHALAAVASLAPVVLSQLSVTSELTPALLGGVLAFVAPPRSSTKQTIALLALSALCWLVYLSLQSIFADKAASLLMLADVEPDQIKSSVAVLENIAGSIRTFCGVVFAAIIGLRLNPSVAVLSPEKTPKRDVERLPNGEPVDVPDPSAGQTGGPVG